MPKLLAAALFAVLTLAAVPARAMTAEEQKAVQAGLDALYRCDYDGAEKLFDDSVRAHPGDPVYSLGYATAVWWRMENDFAPAGSPEEKRFQAAVSRAIDDAKRAGRGDNAEGYLYLGCALGLRGRREASQHHWFAAYLDGRHSYKYERKAVKLDPQLYDAYLGIGAFDYYVATLGRFVRAFSFTSGGDKTLGLQELHQAAEHGQFASSAAKLLLVGIDWTFEKNPRDAWAILQDLTATYPDSPLVGGMRLIGLYHLRDAAGLKREAAAFLAKAKSGAPFYGPIDEAGALYFLGLGEQLSAEYDAALGSYRAALEKIPPGHPLRGLVALFIGESQDLQGQRAAAVASYQQALRERPLWGVPRYARFLLKHPFRAQEDPLPPRNVDLGGSGAPDDAGGNS